MQIFRKGHFAAPAVEMEGEALTVVKEEQRLDILHAMMLRTYAQLVADTVLRSHEFGSRRMSKFISFGQSPGSGFGVKLFGKVI